MTEIRRVGLFGADGHTMPAGDYLPVENPVDGTVWAEALEATGEHVDQVVDGAQLAYETTWRDLAPDRRGAMMRSWADLVLEHKDEITELELTDVGHLVPEIVNDIEKFAQWLTYYSGLADKVEGKTLANYPDRLAYQIREPYGVVAGVNPFNGNPVMFGMKAGPALAAGNCLILKAPEIAPVATFRIAELALEAGLPPGVLNVITGRGHVTGQLLCEHPGIGALAFTGGPEAARSVIRQSATNMIPLGLELGGKSAVILLEDADLRSAIPSALHSNFVKSGQSCVAGSRIFVPESIHEQVCDQLAHVASRVHVGDPRDPKTTMGAVISRHQRDRIDRIVTESVAQGARRLVGGHPAEDGNLARGSFYQPTVLVDVEDSHVVARTETFGPVASVLSYSDLDEVLARANGLRVGLTAQVWGNDASRIQYLARRLEAGTVWVNTYRSVHQTVPFGGVKESGYGRENGLEALELYSRTKAVVWDLSGAERTLPYQD